MISIARDSYLWTACARQKRSFILSVRYLVQRKYEKVGKGAKGKAISEASRRLFRDVLTVDRPYRGRTDERISLRALGSGVITRYMNAVALENVDGTTVCFTVPDPVVSEVNALKELTWFYIIERPSLAIIQRGRREIIRTLFDVFATAAKADKLHMFPVAYVEHLELAETEHAKRRIVTDLIASMSEASAEDTYLRAKGVSRGSLLSGGVGL